MAVDLVPPSSETAMTRVIPMRDAPLLADDGRATPSIPADAGFDAEDTNRSIVPR